MLSTEQLIPRTRPPTFCWVQGVTNTAERFCRKALRAKHTATPRVITVDKHAAYPQ